MAMMNGGGHVHEREHGNEGWACVLDNDLLAWAEMRKTHTQRQSVQLRKYRRDST